MTYRLDLPPAVVATINGDQPARSAQQPTGEKGKKCEITLNIKFAGTQKWMDFYKLFERVSITLGLVAKRKHGTPNVYIITDNPDKSKADKVLAEQNLEIRFKQLQEYVKALNNQPENSHKIGHDIVAPAMPVPETVIDPNLDPELNGFRGSLEELAIRLGSAKAADDLHLNLRSSNSRPAGHTPDRFFVPNEPPTLANEYDVLWRSYAQEHKILFLAAIAIAEIHLGIRQVTLSGGAVKIAEQIYKLIVALNKSKQPHSLIPGLLKLITAYNEAK